LKKKDLFSKNKDVIFKEISKYRVLTSAQLSDLLDTFKDKGLTSQSLSYSKYLLKLIELGLQQHTVLLKGVPKTRYTFDTNLDEYAFINSFEKNGFFSMSTALNLQGYSNFNKNYIFFSTEQSSKEEYSSRNIIQENIDSAFKKEYRYTHKRVKYFDKNIVLLNPKHTNEIGVIEYGNYNVSNINRVFVEMIVNVQYFKSYTAVLDVLKPLKDKFDINEIFLISKKFDFIYPYIQLFGFTLEKIGFTKEELNRFSDEIKNLRFYTQKNMGAYLFDNYWKIYYV